MKSRAFALSFLLVAPLMAQDISFGGDRASAAKKGHVVLLSDSAQVEAGKTQVVELRFRVDDGFHINSHQPKDELLIPTVLTMEPAVGVKVSGEEYPKGAPFKLAMSNGDVLDVYQGEFRVKLRMVVPKGATVVTGALHYQACDSAACFPPRSLPVKVVVMGK